VFGGDLTVLCYGELGSIEKSIYYRASRALEWKRPSAAAVLTGVGDSYLWHAVAPMQPARRRGPAPCAVRGAELASASASEACSALQQAAAGAGGAAPLAAALAEHCGATPRQGQAAAWRGAVRRGLVSALHVGADEAERALLSVVEALRRVARSCRASAAPHVLHLQAHLVCSATEEVVTCAPVAAVVAAAARLLVEELLCERRAAVEAGDVKLSRALLPSPLLIKFADALGAQPANAIVQSYVAALVAVLLEPRNAAPSPSDAPVATLSSSSAAAKKKERWLAGIAGEAAQLLAGVGLGSVDGPALRLPALLRVGLQLGADMLPLLHADTSRDLGRQYVEMCLAAEPPDSTRAWTCIKDLRLEKDFPAVVRAYRRSALEAAQAKGRLSEALFRLERYRDAELSSFFLAMQLRLGQHWLALVIARRLGMPQDGLTALGLDLALAEEQRGEWEAVHVQLAPALKGCIVFVDSEPAAIAMADWLDGLSGRRAACGLDSEWRPHMGKGVSSTSILQLACRARVFVLDLIWLLPTDGKQLASAASVELDEGSDLNEPGGLSPYCSLLPTSPRQHEEQEPPVEPAGAGNARKIVLGALARLFSRRDVHKIGFQFKGDLENLRRSYPNEPCWSLPLWPLVELNRLAVARAGPDAPWRVTAKGKKAGGSLSDLVHEVLPGRRRLSKLEQMSDWEARPLRAEQLEYAAIDAHVAVQIFDELFEDNAEGDRALREAVMSCNAARVRDGGALPDSDLPAGALTDLRDRCAAANLRCAESVVVAQVPRDVQVALVAVSVDTADAAIPEVARVLGVNPASICKSIVMVERCNGEDNDDDDEDAQLIVCIVRGDSFVDERALAANLKRQELTVSGVGPEPAGSSPVVRLSKASERQCVEQLGQRPGTIGPLAPGAQTVVADSQLGGLSDGLFLGVGSRRHLLFVRTLADLAALARAQVLPVSKARTSSTRAAAPAEEAVQQQRKGHHHHYHHHFQADTPAAAERAAAAEAATAEIGGVDTSASDASASDASDADAPDSDASDSSGAFLAPRFIVDNMLGRLGKMLRIVGHDCLYMTDLAGLPELDHLPIDKSLGREAVMEEKRRRQRRRLDETKHVLEVARSTGRVLLTADSKLTSKGVSPPHLYVVRGNARNEQFDDVCAHFGLALESHKLLSRCVKCNSSGFEVVSPTVVAELKKAGRVTDLEVPDGTLAEMDEFYRCTNQRCGAWFWQGGKFRATIVTFGHLFDGDEGETGAADKAAVSSPPEPQSRAVLAQLQDVLARHNSAYYGCEAGCSR
jgi:uncharacterized protein with PIN domain